MDRLRRELEAGIDPGESGGDVGGGLGKTAVVAAEIVVDFERPARGERKCIVKSALPGIEKVSLASGLEWHRRSEVRQRCRRRLGFGDLM